MGSTDHSASYDESECGEIHTELRSGSLVANSGLEICWTGSRKNLAPRPGTKLIESRSRMWKSLRNLVGHALLTTLSRAMNLTSPLQANIMPCLNSPENNRTLP